MLGINARNEIEWLSFYWRNSQWRMFVYLRNTVRGYMDVFFWDDDGQYAIPWEEAA